MIRGYNFVIYNGITLEVVKLVSHKREAVFDKAKINYLYTRHTLVVRAILAPTVSEHYLGTRYRPNTSTLEPTEFTGPIAINQGNMANANVGADPVTGLETDNAIRHALMAPRGRLIYAVGGNYLIDSPHKDQACDVTFGPIPLFCHIEKIAGMGSTSVLFGIQTDLSQCPLFEDKFSAVLSHEYSQQVEIDEQFRTKRTTRGEIRLRADVSASKPCTPDAFREYFALSCPPHYKRDQIRVVQHPDMTRLEYAIVDVEKERPIINGFEIDVQYDIEDEDGNVTHKRVDLKGAVSRLANLKVTHTVGSSRKFLGVYNGYFAIPDPGIMAPGGNMGKALGDAIRNAGNLALGQWFDRANEFVRAVDRGNELDRLRHGAPNVYEELNIELFGTPMSTRYELELLGWYILTYRMPLVSQADNPGPFRDSFYAGGEIEFNITHDVMSNYVKMQYKYSRATPAAKGLGSVLSGDNKMMFGPMLSGELSLVGDEIIPGITLHPYRRDHTTNPNFNIPAFQLDPNKHNPWGRPGDMMHGTDPMPVRVVHIHDTQCEPPHSHDEALNLREENIDPLGVKMTRQPEYSWPVTAPEDVEDPGVGEAGTPPAEKEQCEKEPDPPPGP